jgi:Holliday junction DNA helicase RuvA
MIATVRGILQHVGEGEIVVEVGGVGLRLTVPSSVLAGGAAIGHPIFLQTRLLVREDALHLYGFGNPEQVELFDLLLQVSGVGPKLAMAILSHLSPDTLRAAVGKGQHEVLTRVPGIGRKTAERIAFHLKDKIGGLGLQLVTIPEADTDLLAILTGLGYTLVEAQGALQSLPPDAPEEAEERLRLALQYFAHR